MELNELLFSTKGILFLHAFLWLFHSTPMIFDNTAMENPNFKQTIFVQPEHIPPKNKGREKSLEILKINFLLIYNPVTKP